MNKQKDKQGTPYKCNLAGLVIISELDQLIEDPATLVGLLLQAKSSFKSMTYAQKKRLQNAGIKAMSERKQKNIRNRRHENSQKNH